MNIVFFGTPEFAVPSLEAIIKAGHSVRAVVTKHDAGRRAVPSPVKLLAEAAALRVLQPHSIRTPEFMDVMRPLSPDAIVVVAYGKILPSELLSLPPRGCINVHASLLPRYRGAAPIQRAIINGETQTGVTTMLMDEGVDTGSAFLSAKTAITGSDTALSLTVRLAALGAVTLIETLNGIDRGTLKATAQVGVATYAPPINKDDCLIQWTRPAVEIVNLIRGLSPFPGAYTVIGGRRVKILRAVVSGVPPGGHAPGEIARQGHLLIAASDGLVSVEELQPEGKKPMQCRDYLCGLANKGKETLHVG
ncbi:MAG: methionyl-tRNA formyltransferase [Nitrospirae bacterium]|nr:methionyl-tRNA formyltransferase [Nitrospirota bacterium]